MRQISEKTIVNTLTGGRESIDYCYILNGRLRAWRPQPESYSIIGYLLDDDDLYRACYTYVAERGAVFNTVDEVMKWAKDHNWPKLDVFITVVSEAL